MPELEVQIGGRGFKVTCQDGQEHFLRSAAAMLDAEVAPLLTQSAPRPTDVKMLLTAGLMLADRTAAVEDELRGLRARVSELEAKVGQVIERVDCFHWATNRFAIIGLYGFPPGLPRLYSIFGVGVEDGNRPFADVAQFGKRSFRT